MTTLTACPICGTPRPADRAGNEPWCCSLVCYRSFHRLDQTQPPPCHDAVTTTCPVCARPFAAVGRQRYCSGACRATAYRRRRDTTTVMPAVPAARPKRPITVYECDTCDSRALGEQRCDDCNTWMRRVGIGGCCPACDEPIACNELLDLTAGNHGMS